MKIKFVGIRGKKIIYDRHVCDHLKHYSLLVIGQIYAELHTLSTASLGYTPFGDSALLIGEHQETFGNIKGHPIRDSLIILF